METPDMKENNFKLGIDLKECYSILLQSFSDLIYFQFVCTDMAHEWFDIQARRGGFGRAWEVQVACCCMCVKGLKALELVKDFVDESVLIFLFLHLGIIMGKVMFMKWPIMRGKLEIDIRRTILTHFLGEVRKLPLVIWKLHVIPIWISWKG